MRVLTSDWIFIPFVSFNVVYQILMLKSNYVACLMDKGIIIGVEHEIASRSTLPFVLFRHTTSVKIGRAHV